jgi:hypothetical protein
MKLKATQESIFTLNGSLKNKDFNDYVELKTNSIFKGIFVGKMYNSNIEFEHVQLTYKPESIKELNYLYHIKILGAGLQYKHLAYVKASIFQHIWIWIVNRFIKFITNFENIFKILTILCLFISTSLPFFKKESINIYVSEPKVKNFIVVDTTRNAVNFTDTTKITIDSVTTKKQIK